MRIVRQVVKVMNVADVCGDVHSEELELGKGDRKVKSISYRTFLYRSTKYEVMGSSTHHDHDRV